MWQLIAEVVTNESGEAVNSPLSWQASSLLMVLVGVVGWVVWASLRSYRKGNRNVDQDWFHPINKSK